MDRSVLEQELSALGAHLGARRQALLDAWQRSAQSDRRLTTATSLSRAQFYDHIPAMLDGLERKLCATGVRESLAATEDEAVNAESHGLQRWQQGYNEQEVMREWIWLDACLADELDRYAQARPGLPAEVLGAAWRLVSEFLVTGMSESVGQYVRMQQAEASARLRALEEAHRTLGSLDEQRTAAWREAAHDLRGNLSIVHNVAAVLQARDAAGASAQRLDPPLSLLGRGIAALHALIEDLTTQARLDAGREQREIRQFDAARLVGDLCATSQTMAEQHGLTLVCDAPGTLLVEGDPVKVGRIAQNLLLNALHYTRKGTITVSCSEAQAGAGRWSLCVADTGPGLPAAAAAPLSNALDAATRDSHRIDAAAPGAAPAPAAAAAGASPVSASSSVPGQAAEAGHRSSSGRGEGIGLAIVKRLCQLLDAALELETAADQGTVFRVTFPRAYPKG